MQVCDSAVVRLEKKVKKMLFCVSENEKFYFKEDQSSEECIEIVY